MVDFFINAPGDILILNPLLKSINIIASLNKCSKSLVISRLPLYDVTKLQYESLTIAVSLTRVQPLVTY